MAMNRNYFKEAWRDWSYIFRRELRTIFHDQGLLIFFILVPLFYPIIYSLIYNNETAREVPVVVVDNSQTAFSRDYLRRLNATAEVRIVSHAADMASAQKMIKNREAYGVVFIPATFTDDIVNMKQTHVSIFVDMGGFLYYKALLLANTEVSLEMNADIKLSRQTSGLTEEQELALTAPIRYEQVTLYNPSSGFAQFLIPAVMILLLHQTLILGICLAAGTAREKETEYSLLPMQQHRNGLVRIVLGKGAAYFIIYLWNVVYCLGIVLHIFKLPQLTNALHVWPLMIPFLLATIFFAMTVSGLFRHRENCFMVVVFSSVPLLFLSGISWPWEAIPAFWRSIACFFPSTFGVRGFIKLNNLGANLNDIGTEILLLWIQTVVYAFTTLLIYHYGFAKMRIRLRRKKQSA